MRTCYSLALLLLLSACGQRDAPRHDCAYKEAQCLTPLVPLAVWKFGGYPDSLAGMIVSPYTKDGTFNHAKKEITTGTIDIDARYDYELYFPNMDDTVRISNISFTPVTKSICPYGPPCSNRFDSMTVMFRGVPQEYRFEQTDILSSYFIIILK